MRPIFIHPVYHAAILAAAEKKGHPIHNLNKGKELHEAFNTLGIPYDETKHPLTQRTEENKDTPLAPDEFDIKLRNNKTVRITKEITETYFKVNDTDQVSRAKGIKKIIKVRTGYIITMDDSKEKNFTDYLVEHGGVISELTVATIAAFTKNEAKELKATNGKINPAQTALQSIFKNPRFRTFATGTEVVLITNPTNWKVIENLDKAVQVISPRELAVIRLRATLQRTHNDLKQVSGWQDNLGDEKRIREDFKALGIHTGGMQFKVNGDLEVALFEASTSGLKPVITSTLNLSEDIFYFSYDMEVNLRAMFKLAPDKSLTHTHITSYLGNSDFISFLEEKPPVLITHHKNKDKLKDLANQGFSVQENDETFNLIKLFVNSPDFTLTIHNIDTALIQLGLLPGDAKPNKIFDLQGTSHACNLLIPNFQIKEIKSKLAAKRDEQTLELDEELQSMIKCRTGFDNLQEGLQSLFSEGKIGTFLLDNKSKPPIFISNSSKGYIETLRGLRFNLTPEFTQLIKMAGDSNNLLEALKKLSDKWNIKVSYNRVGKDAKGEYLLLTTQAESEIKNLQKRKFRFDSLAIDLIYVASSENSVPAALRALAKKGKIKLDYSADMGRDSEGEFVLLSPSNIAYLESLKANYHEVDENLRNRIKAAGNGKITEEAIANLIKSGEIKSDFGKGVGLHNKKRFLLLSEPSWQYLLSLTTNIYYLTPEREAAIHSATGISDTAKALDSILKEKKQNKPYGVGIEKDQFNRFVIIPSEIQKYIDHTLVPKATHLSEMEKMIIATGGNENVVSSAKLLGINIEETKEKDKYGLNQENKEKLQSLKEEFIVIPKRIAALLCVEQTYGQPSNTPFSIPELTKVLAKVNPPNSDQKTTQPKLFKTKGELGTQEWILIKLPKDKRKVLSIIYAASMPTNCQSDYSTKPIRNPRVYTYGGEIRWCDQTEMKKIIEESDNKLKDSDFSVPKFSSVITEWTRTHLVDQVCYTADEFNQRLRPGNEGGDLTLISSTAGNEKTGTYSSTSMWSSPPNPSNSSSSSSTTTTTTTTTVTNKSSFNFI